jgi:phosphoglucosamine mutase
MRLGAEVTAINVSPNGVNINLKCGSTHPAALSECVLKVGADAGLAFDGDGDRVMMCDEKGQIVDGDRMMAICAIAMKKRGELKNNAVIATIMSNAGLEIALENEGIKIIRTDVGDRYVAEEMVRIDAVIGGEQSGHLLLPNRTPTGDGMVTGLAVLAEMKEAGAPLSALASVIHTYPQLLRNVRVKDRNAWKSNPEIQEAIDTAKHRLSRPEWLSVRASGTEPLVRVMAQDTDRTRVEEIVFGLCDLIESRFCKTAFRSTCANIPRLLQVMNRFCVDISIWITKSKRFFTNPMLYVLCA